MSEPPGTFRPAAYRKPPEATRFRPGQSGNPKGRPRGSRNFGTAIEKELNATVVVNENGKRKQITKRDGIAKQFVNKALTGDARAFAALLNEARRQESAGPPGPTADAEQPFTADDQLTIANVLRRIRETTPIPHVLKDPEVDGRDVECPTATPPASKSPTEPDDVT